MAPKKKAIECSAHIKQRNMATAHIERISEFVTSAGDSLSIEELECRLEIVETYFQQALEHQNAIEELEHVAEDTNAVHIRGEIEDLYCGVKVHIRALIKKKTSIAPSNKVLESTSCKLPENLPKLKLPTFAGKYSEFPNFFRLFRTLVDGEDRLSPIEKFNHLLSCLSGPALNTVKTLDVTEQNYEVAVSLLESRYSNKFLICQEHIKELFHLDKVQKGSPEQLRFLIDTVSARYNALLSLVNHEELSQALIVHLVVTALDGDSRAKVEESIDSNKTLSWNDCAKVLTHRCQTLEARESKSNNSDQTQYHQATQKQFNRQSKAVALTTANNNCACCNQNAEHNLWKCPKFLQLSAIERFECVKRLTLCINCLSQHHAVRQCKSTGCKRCNLKHHTLLHRNNASSNNYASQQQQQLHQQRQKQIHPQQQQLHLQQFHPQQQQQGFAQCQQQQKQDDSAPDNSFAPTSGSINQHCHISKENQCQQGKVNKNTILATVRVKITDKFGRQRMARALLDSASQLNFMTRNLAQKLNLNQTKSATFFGGIGESQCKSNYLTDSTLASCTGDFMTTLEFLVLPTITGLQPDRKIDTDAWNIPKDVALADPQFNIPQKVELLIGAEIFFKLFDGNQIELGDGCPTLISTKFGWIVSGTCNADGCQQRALISSKVNSDLDFNLENLVQQFWEMEQVPDTKRKLSQEQADCENHFQQHTKRLSSGRFMVKLPIKIDPVVLGDSKQTAMRRFFSLEKRLSTNQQVKQAYIDFLDQYEADGHMAQINWPVTNSSYYYLPHHCVLRPEKSTTKCRVVFDASAKTTNNLSLNDIMMVGPVVQNDLYDILLRFRLHKYGLMADITAMYRQILVYPEDRRLQNIIWRNNHNEDLGLYQLKTVTYGTASAPFLATRCLTQLAHDNIDNNPVAGNVIKNDFYVDDLITGGETHDEIKTIKHDVTAILQEAKFQLRKWYSNHKDFLDSIPEDEREKPITINSSDVVKALGIIWDANTDCFKFLFSVSQTDVTKVTKRMVLSELSKLFDPIGFIKPLIVKAKVFLQELWLKKLKWDEPLPEDLTNAWKSYVEQLTDLNELRVPRYVLVQHSSVQLHGFADASTRAYGCCFYLRCVDSSGRITVNLYTSKSKVSPIKVVRSLPCLELSAAHLLAQLLQKLHKIRQFDEVILWSDSVIVLSWLAEHASTLNTFVANRVSYIQEMTANNQWKYVPSKDNPADIVSRGATVPEINSSIWFTGPEFLRNPEDNWPKHPKRCKPEELPERKPQKSILLTVRHHTLLDIIYSSSNLHQICTRFAYVRRFINNCRNKAHRAKMVSTQISAIEIEDAFVNIISLIQHNVFGAEIDFLKREKALGSNSTLKALNPFVEDQNGMLLLKVGGRLKHAQLPYEAKYPLILPKHNPFVELYFRHIHIKNLHAGAEVLLSKVRQKLWVIGARELARKTVQRCVHCFKYRPKMLGQIMGDLPKDRVTPVKPFTYCGVDFCGPILTTTRIRGRAKYKSYIAVFVCFVTKATHMEIVSNLTADAFIAALKRFVGRRGLCKTIYCDNATNFVGARNALKELRTAFMSDQVQKELTKWCVANDIEFKHIPPRSPHFGGIWEAAVKSAKTLLYKIMQSALLTYEELSTVTAQIEGILNSRPLTALSADPSDEQALTPAHFLCQSRAECIVEPAIPFNKISTYKHWQQISAIQQHFWKRWTKEYLTTLQNRRKWNANVPNIAIGMLVMVHEDNLPPQKWLLGRVTQIFPGSDGKIRVAEVKTTAGTFRRAIAKLAAIPVDNSNIETP